MTEINVDQLERMMQVSKDTKKEFSYNKATGKWSWQEDQEFDTFLDCLEDAVSPYFSSEADEDKVSYLQPYKATWIRVFKEGGNWVIDAADGSGELTEKCWTHYKGEPMGLDEALTAVAEFADEIGRPDLKNNVYVESENGGWDKIKQTF